MTSPGYGHDARMAAYVRYLERGAATHASYADTAGQQAIAEAERVDQIAAATQVAAEDGERVDSTRMELAALRVELLNVQAAVSTVGLSICLVGLAIVGALGQQVPEPPPMPDLPKADA